MYARQLRFRLATIAVLGALALSSTSVSARLLDDPLFLPLLEFDNQGVLTYDPIDNELTIDATPLALRVAAGQPPINIGDSPKGMRMVRITAVIDEDGRLDGGVGGPDLFVLGEVDLGGGDLRSGVLLIGEISAFGFEDSGGTTDFFDFRAVIDGGLIAPLYGGPGVEIGISVVSEMSSFEGIFTEETGFGGEAKGTIGGLSEVPTGCELSVDATCQVLDEPAADSCVIPPGGANVTYRYKVTNEGDNRIFGIQVMDTLFGTVPGSPIAMLNSGEMTTLSASIFVDGSLVNEVTATGSSKFGERCDDMDSVPVEIEPPSSICLPDIGFETDAGGGMLSAGQVIDDEFASLGVRVTTQDPVSHPAMIFDTSAPSGGDPDLGTPNEDYAGPGIGGGGSAGTPGQNGFSQGKVLIISEDADGGDPDDDDAGGTLVFTFDTPVELDSIGILDIDEDASGGVATAYDSAGGVIASIDMRTLGDNSLQRLSFGVSFVSRLEVFFAGSAALTDIVFCRGVVALCAEPADNDEFTVHPSKHALVLDGIAEDLVFDPPGAFIERPDGTAQLTGTLFDLADPTRGFELLVELSGLTSEPPDGSPKQELSDEAYVENGGPVDPSAWTYYPSYVGSLSGTDEYDGALIALIPRGPAFQVGFGASGKNIGFGASSWFDWTVIAQPDTGVVLEPEGVGDINIDLDVVCPPEDPSLLVRDEFNAMSFDANDGPDTWAYGWMEDDPESGGGGPDRGAVKLREGALRLDDREDTDGAPSAARGVDLSGYTSATLSFDFRITGAVDADDAIAVEVSADGGITYTLLELLTGYEEETIASRSFDLSGFIAADTRVRLRVAAYYGGSDEYFFADNVTIEAGRDR